MAYEWDLRRTGAVCILSGTDRVVADYLCAGQPKPRMAPTDRNINTILNEIKTAPKTSRSGFVQIGNITVSGAVSDNAGTLPGANVYVSNNLGERYDNTLPATTSDANGNYSLTVHPGDYITTSFIGMKKKTVQFGASPDTRIIQDPNFIPVAADGTIKYDFHLLPDGLLGEVVISAKKTNWKIFIGGSFAVILIAFLIGSMKPTIN
jgi:hypothetical protein